MSTNVFKQGTNLYESSQEEMLKNAQTPKGADAAGASPDSSKMFGTQAHKNAKIQRQSQDPTKTLQRANRIKQTPEPSATDSAVQKVDRLKNLGTIETRLEGMIQSRLLQSQQEVITQQALNQQYIQDFVEKDKQEKVKTALAEFAQAQVDGDQGAQQEALGSLQVLGISPKDVTTYFQAAPEQIGAMVSEAQPDQVVLGDIFEDETELAQTAQELGVTSEQLKVMSPDEFEQTVQALEAREFNRVQALEAELPNAVGARREQIIEELRGLAGAGVTGAEAQFDRLQRDIEEARTIDIAGEQFNLSDMLEDDELSEYIMDSVTNEEIMADIRANSSQLAEFIERNRDAIAALAEEAKDVSKGFQTLQEEFGTTLQGVGEDLYKAIFGEEIPEYVTDATKAKIEENMSNSGVWQAVSEDDSLKNILMTDPELAVKLNKYSKDEIIGLHNLNKELDAIGRKVLGLDETGFPTDPAKIAVYDSVKESLTTLEEQEPRIYQELFDYVGEGGLSVAQINTLASVPEEWDTVKATIDGKKEMARIGDDFDELVEYAFGGMGVDEINQYMKALKIKADLNDQEAADEYNRLKMLIGSDGDLNEYDIPKLKKSINRELNINKALSDKADILQFKKQNKKLPSIATIARTPQGLLAELLLDTPNPTTRDIKKLGLETLQTLANDKKITGSVHGNLVKQALDELTYSTAEQADTREFTSIMNGLGSDFIDKNGTVDTKAPQVKLGKYNTDLNTKFENILQFGEAQQYYNTVAEKLQADIDKIDAQMSAASSMAVEHYLTQAKKELQDSLNNLPKPKINKEHREKLLQKIQIADRAAGSGYDAVKSGAFAKLSNPKTPDEEIYKIAQDLYTNWSKWWNYGEQ